MNQPIARRTLLKTAAVAATGVFAMSHQVANAESPPVAAPASTPATEKKFTVYKSVKWGMIGEKISVLDKFKLLQDLGYDGVELDSPGGVNKKEALEASIATGLPIHGVVDSTHWNIRLSSKDEATRERGLQDLLTAIKDSHFCGGNAVLLVAGHGQDGTQEEIAARSVAQIKKALPLAAKLGVHILIENVWNSMGYVHNGPGDQSADGIAKFIDDCQSGWVGSYFDIGNHRKYGVPSQWARTLGKRIIKCDVKDFNHKTDKWADIGEGTVDWPEVCKALGEINFHGWVTAEVGGGNRDRLKKIKAQMDQVFSG